MRRVTLSFKSTRNLAFGIFNLLIDRKHIVRFNIAARLIICCPLIGRPRLIELIERIVLLFYKSAELFLAPLSVVFV